MEHKSMVTDLSVLTPWFDRHVVIPLFKFVPWWLPANIITIMSNFCIMIALIATVLVTTGHIKFWPLVPLLILAYATGDCLDGKQARKTRTCSKLGEFLDHFLDIFVNGFLMSMLVLTYGITDPVAVALLLAISYLALSGFYFEQYHARQHFFEKIGAFEAIVIYLVLISMGFIPSVKEFIMTDMALNISIFDLVLTGMAFGALFTLKRSLDRTGPSAGKGFAFFFLLTAATAFLATALFQPAVIMFMVTAYCGSYVGRLHTAYLLDHPEPPPDFVFPLFLLTAYITGMPLLFVSAISVFYQSFSIIISFMAGFVPLKKYWLWVNPGDEYVDVYTT